MKNMKNILFLTTMYPDPLRPATDVCHYYTREWVKLGYNVIVINLRSMFPRIFTDAARMFPKLAHRYIGNHVEMDRNMNVIEHQVDNVQAYSMPVFKYIPHGKYPKRSILKTVNAVEEICKKRGFEPDAIIGHFFNPTTEVIYELKKLHPNAKTCIVFHEGPEGMQKHYAKNAREILDSYDIIGFRHKTMGEWYEKTFGKLKKTFVCYSGTKPTYLDTPMSCEKEFGDGQIKRFLYVGQFTYNKCVGETVKALHHAYPQGGFHLTCVGSGGTALEDIKHYIEQEHLQDNVSFAGQIDRDEIIRYYDANECFIMISKSEAFGLVYLEAMARGCICVGTKGQGIDGVIVDGVNGFLCKGGDSEELTSIIKKINALSAEEKRKLSENARHTAEELSDFNVAKNYIETVMNA